jgi:hypothetical protein
MLSIMPDSIDGTKLYLDYLDKEMTIMGILSTFCVAAAALVIDRVASAEHNSFFGQLAVAHLVQILIGASFLMASGLCFYLQRADLAWYYGGICMSVAKPDTHEWDTKRWLKEMYSWAPWLKYRAGFMFLTCTAVVFVYVIYRASYPSEPALLWLEWSILILIVICVSVHCVVLSTYRYADRPYKKVSLKTFQEDWRDRGQL